MSVWFSIFSSPFISSVVQSFLGFMAASEYIMLFYWGSQVFNLKLSQRSIMSGRVKVRLRLHFMRYFNTWWGFESRMRPQAAAQKSAVVEVTIIGILICDAGGGRTRDPGPVTWFVTEAAWRGPTHNNPAITMFCEIINDWFVSDVSSCQNVNSLNTLPIVKQSGTWERPARLRHAVYWNYLSKKLE